MNPALQFVWCIMGRAHQDIGLTVLPTNTQSLSFGNHKTSQEPGKR